MGPLFYLRRLSMLRAVGAIQADGSVKLFLVTPNGKRQRITVEGGDFQVKRKLRRSPASSGDAPHYLSRVDTNYWIKPLPDHCALYFQFIQSGAR